MMSTLRLQSLQAFAKGQAARVLLLAVLLLGHALPLLAGEPQVLTVRPEKIEAIVGKKTAVALLNSDEYLNVARMKGE